MNSNARSGRFRRRPLAIVRAGAVLFVAAATVHLAGCHSYHVDATVENLTGGPIQLLEVDYPSASFGAEAMAAGAVMHYSFQLRGSGPLKVQYAGAGRHPVEVAGPSVAERQEGTLRIELLPAGKVEFHSDLTPPK